jgi:GT2 family glycosyltransferase
MNSNPSSPRVSILIVTWNRQVELPRAIQSALAQSHANTEVVVMDNASTDGTAAMVRRQFPQVKLVVAESNLGCPSGRNFGFRHCSGEFIYCLDDDGWLQPDAVGIALRRAVRDPKIAVVMSRIHEFENGCVVRTLPEERDQPVYQASFCGGCSMIRREALDQVGGFPEDFFRQAEEEDLAIRLLDAGWFCFLEPESVMFHAPSQAGRDSKAFLYYGLRNTNKTGLRVWSFPWCVLRPLVNLGHSIRLMITQRYLALPFLVLGNLARDLAALPGRRRPVAARTNELFLRLGKQPSLTKPV